ncbi:NADPH:quinone oxidoreductase family protein [Maribius pontilimi]|uniref:NADPH:quinone oxidoreductase family protein n=1 Tax=Palleronia pontilimi TaxID=1964209 RepID=A0A934IID0_9RHOB|nr:NADPH:quinone oxidoreductase family protein [Palleronia pontilimi]MBJ3762464.1 NADPH:quinone oxidoreductase family protein [Palleronia pontilimi]
MRAFQVVSHDQPPEICDIDTPEPGDGQVRVRIAACGLNFADMLVADGTYQDIPPLPATLGMELAGTVDAIGSGVTDFAPGDRVAIFAGHGGLAEYGVFDAARAKRLPDAMPFDDAAAFMVAYGTSHLALDHRARLRPGERLVVLGASGGVGLTAVELGKLMGAEVVAVARGDDKLAVAREAGADHCINSETADLRAELKALGGADVIYDPVGGDLLDAAMRALRPEARVIVIGFASGQVPKFKANHLLVKNVSILGYYWGGYMAFAPERLTASLETLLGWYAEGRISPHISHHLPLERAGEGLELLRSRKSTGKVVITVAP